MGASAEFVGRIPQVSKDLCTVGLQSMFSKFQNRQSELIDTLTPARTLVISRTRIPSNGRVPGRGTVVEYRRHCATHPGDVLDKAYTDRRETLRSDNMTVILLDLQEPCGICATIIVPVWTVRSVQRSSTCTLRHIGTKPRSINSDPPPIFPSARPQVRLMTQFFKTVSCAPCSPVLSKRSGVSL